MNECDGGSLHLEYLRKRVSTGDYAWIADSDLHLGSSQLHWPVRRKILMPPEIESQPKPSSLDFDILVPNSILVKNHRFTVRIRLPDGKAAGPTRRFTSVIDFFVAGNSCEIFRKPW